MRILGYDCDWDEVNELRAQSRHQRIYQTRLSQHPDCRDPDHPGCKHCNDDNESFEA
ncbi:hypothetical protein VPH49_21770 [Pseudomonas luteola]|uniref:hypothetical protein n=1 Tax=Pseudomonas luteola TaxID=47886 RepID=UPI003A8A5ED3